ncbi:tetratricopeptide repeat protein [Massilia cavernae]|uniref:Ancillary SecYEG translocon subunit/Cell division coordinator CpoB TPR domain-containing protein n=1 Tax=Massilia cavernae TaxID=2320864 RepID=A0A418Y898_9BURK|nr:tetratricopeptide repeat protein [Massilia cavernae]RJG27617.1 hypothetical protein D3872_00525 [Massilia cavernae]
MPEQKQPLWSRSVAAALAVSLGITGVGCSGNTEVAPLIAEARKYRAQGEIKAAVIQLKNAIQRDEGSGAARILLAEVYLDEGDAASADKDLRRAMAAGGDAAQVAPLLGKAMLMQGQYDRLLADIVPVGAASVRPALLALRGSAFLGLGKVEPARELLNDALKLAPHSIEALIWAWQAGTTDGRRQCGRSGQLDRARAGGRPADTELLRLRATSTEPRQGRRGDGSYIQKNTANCVRQRACLVRHANLHSRRAGCRKRARLSSRRASPAPGAAVVILPRPC